VSLVGERSGIERLLRRTATRLGVGHHSLEQLADLRGTSIRTRTERTRIDEGHAPVVNFVAEPTVRGLCCAALQHREIVVAAGRKCIVELRVPRVTRANTVRWYTVDERPRARGEQRAHVGTRLFHAHARAAARGRTARDG